MTQVLDAIGLGKDFGATAALKDVTFSIGAGRIVGLLGPNGSGKTTLIKLAAGLLQPTRGKVLVTGIAPGTTTKAMVSYLPDRAYFDNWMKVKDCLAMFADFYADFERQKAADMLGFMGVGMDAAVRSLSKGTKEKLQLALAMSRKAMLYLLDEPIGGVDPAARDYILDTIIRNYNEAGTVVISTHLIFDIENVLDDVIFLMGGRVERASGVDEIREATGKSVDEVFREVFRCYSQY
jgi:ABC-2 type transport system ATP-binding protein